MAYDDSEALQPNSTYNLGGYTFELKVQTVHEPGEEDVVSVFAICRSPDGTRETVPMDFPAGTTVENWSVEANETEATVYATIKYEDVDLNTSVVQPAAITGAGTYLGSRDGKVFWYSNLPSVCYMDGNTQIMVVFSPNPGSDSLQMSDGTMGGGGPLSPYTYQGRTVYYRVHEVGPPISYALSPNTPSNGTVANTAWMALYGKDAGKTEEVLLARFAIDLGEAGGGPDGDWDEPGDVGPDPEKYYTLTVSVTGASAGSSSGTPLEPGQTGGYGNGGTGGNGGGGGAGASTVIIYEFATNKADNVVQDATARGPGTGGPGGKGGKGGDGCILIFY